MDKETRKVTFLASDRIELKGKHISVLDMVGERVANRGHNNHKQIPSMPKLGGFLLSCYSPAKP